MRHPAAEQNTGCGVVTLMYCSRAWSKARSACWQALHHCAAWLVGAARNAGARGAGAAGREASSGRSR